MFANLTLRQLRACLAVAQEGGAQKAARRLHLSQAAISDRVAALEAAVGVALFARGGRGMSPTAAGRLLVRRIAAAFAHLRAIEAPAPGFADKVAAGQLRAAAMVVECGDFSAAARRLGRSPAGIARGARDLEALFGAPLWQKHGSKVNANATARQLLRQAGLAAAEIRLGLEELAELNGRTDGLLAVGALPLPRSRWLPDAVAATLANHPDARVSLMDGPFEEQLAALQQGRIDVILGALRPPTPDLAQEAVFSDSLSILLRGDHPRRDPRQLDGLAWILPPTGTPARRCFDDFLAARDLPPPARVIEAQSLGAVIALLRRTDHAALLSARQVEAELAAGILRRLGPPLPNSRHPIGIITRPDYLPTRLGLAFLANLRRTGVETPA